MYNISIHPIIYYSIIVYYIYTIIVYYCKESVCLVLSNSYSHIPSIHESYVIYKCIIFYYIVLYHAPSVPVPQIRDLSKQRWIRKFPPLAVCGDETYRRIKQHGPVCGIVYV